MEAEGMVLFTMPNGTMLELNEPQAASAEYAINDGLVFGFRVDDVEAASAALEVLLALGWWGMANLGSSTLASPSDSLTAERSPIYVGGCPVPDPLLEKDSAR